MTLLDLRTDHPVYLFKAWRGFDLAIFQICDRLTKSVRSLLLSQNSDLQFWIEIKTPIWSTVYNGKDAPLRPSQFYDSLGISEKDIANRLPPTTIYEFFYHRHWTQQKTEILLEVSKETIPKQLLRNLLTLCDV